MLKIHALALTMAALALLSAGQAQALTVTNRDAADQRLRITDGGDESVTQDVVIAADETLGNLCEDGCTILLGNGVQESFEGYESIYIENGRFVIAE